jgi:alpha-galactosidase
MKFLPAVAFTIACVCPLSQAQPGATKTSASVAPDGSVRLESGAARFVVAEGHGGSAYLLRNGMWESLDAADTGQPDPDSIAVDGRVLQNFEWDRPGVRVTDIPGGKRVAIPATAHGPGGILVGRVTTLEVREQSPQLLFTTTTYKNTGGTAFRITDVQTLRRRLAAPGNAGGVWSFQGAAEEWGRDDVVELKRGFSRKNTVGAPNATGTGGGIPVNVFWNRRLETAIGEIDELPSNLEMPVAVDETGGVRAFLAWHPGLSLAPGQSYVTPLAFEYVSSGDYYEALQNYSKVLASRGWPAFPANPEAYQVSWCGWGFRFNVTAKDMLAVVPSLKEFGVHWATLDDRWFDAYGDWNPRKDTFPGASIRQMVDEYHRHGIYVELWWLPLGVELPGPKDGSHVFIEAKIAREHPDWLVLDKDGKPARMARELGTFCPAVPEVQAFYRELTRKFIAEWGFDGHKLDNIFSVPPCYNPRHHHKSPFDSVNAIGEVYKIIYETTIGLKPYSVTQSCPCGVPPSPGWLPYMNQAVTADPIGSVQVRRRIKMYKALLGPRAAVYGDHVELTDVLRKGGRVEDSGRDFASTVGVGGVVGTKFVFPPAGKEFAAVSLTPEKQIEWKKWIGIYNDKMLSNGEFRNLYVTGFDNPEAYAIEKSGKTYYAFFAGLPDDSFRGEIELRGLATGRYAVTDYVHNRDLGVVDAAKPRLSVAFTGSLLLEVKRVGGSSPAAGADERPGLFFREDWAETAAADPITQEHVANPNLALGLYGPGRTGIRKSHHDKPADDPFYVWSGLCQGNWLVTLRHKESMVDLTGHAKIRWRSEQSGFRRLHIVLKLAGGGWLVGDRSDDASADWRVREFNIEDIQWRVLKIKDIVEGARVEHPDLSRVDEIGFTDLMPGGNSDASSRVDWIEVYGRPVPRTPR